MIKLTLFSICFYLSSCQVLNATNQQGRATNYYANIVNKVTNTMNINLEPTAPFQSIKGFAGNKLTIRNSMVGASDPSSELVPTITFDRFQRRVDYRLDLKIYISITHYPLSNLVGDFVFKLVFIFNDTLVTPTTSYIGAEFNLTQNYHPCTGSTISIPGHNFSILTEDNKTYCVETANNDSFTGLFDVDRFLNYSIVNNIINSNHILESISIIGNFKSGSYETLLDYNLIFGMLSYIGPQIPLLPADFKYSLQNLKKLYGQTLWLQSPYLAFPNGPTIKFLADPSNDLTLKGQYLLKLTQSSAVQDGYKYLPLNASIPVIFNVTFSHSVNCNNLTICRTSICYILKYSVRMVYICSSSLSGFQLIGDFVQSMNYTDSSGIKAFDLYEKPNTTQFQPYAYYFLPSIELKTSLDLFYFTRWIISQNKIGINQTVIELARSFKVFSGNGSVSDLTFLPFPLYQYLKCLNSSFYFNKINCVICEIPGCLTCQTSSACLVCKNSSFYFTLNASRKLCVCIEKYYLSGTGLQAVCKSCVQIGCLRCINQTVCTECVDNTKRILVNSSCQCLPGYYYLPTFIDFVCNPCATGCLTCVNNTVCTECVGNTKRILVNSLCQCLPGYYYLATFLQQACEPCATGCLICVNSTGCNACNQTGNWVLSGSSCVCQTPNCQNDSICYLPQNGCDVAFNCIRCSTCKTALNWLRNTTDFQCYCKSGYYQLGSSSQATCESCSFGCSQCTDAVTCLSCSAVPNLVLNTSTCICNSAFYMIVSGTTVTCNSCGLALAGCVACVDTTTCTACDDSLNWVLNESICSCEAKFYQVSTGTAVTCSPCVTGCLQCTDDSTCTVCDTDLNFLLNGSICICQQGYCLTGTQHLKTCIATTMPGCWACSEPQTCTDCHTNLNWALDGISSLCNCQLGYFQSGTGSAAVCQPCIDGCDQCSNATSCNVCNSLLNFFLNVSTLICECLPAFYQIAGSPAACVSCSMPGCIRCTNTTYCTICDSSANWSLLNSNCVCAASFYVTGTASSMACVTCGAGCIQCQNDTVCEKCDTANMWTVVKESQKSYCQCAAGYVLQSHANIMKCSFLSIETVIAMKTSINCLFLDEGVTLENCLTAPPSAKAQAAMGATSTPNLGMLLSISQINGLVDDFAFYVYLDIKYGEKFNKFIRFMWNLTSQKWIPSQLSSFYYEIQDYYSSKVQITNTDLVPQPWYELGEDSSFVNNTRDFWIGSIPCTSVIFALFHILYRILAYLDLRISAKFLNFRWFNILIFTILVQNLQVLAFRAFQQILYAGPPSVQPFRQLFIINQIVCYSTFFFIFVYACAGHLILRIVLKENVNFALDIVNYNNQSACFLTIMQLCKILYGLINASYEVQTLIKIIILTCMQICILLAIIYFRKCFRLKTLLMLLVVEYLMRIVTQTLILMRTICLKMDYSLSQLENDTLGNIELYVLIILMSFAGSQILTSFLREKDRMNEIFNVNQKTRKIMTVKKAIKHIVKQKNKQLKESPISSYKLKINSKQQNRPKGIIKKDKSKTQKQNIQKIFAMQIIHANKTNRLIGETDHKTKLKK